MAYINKEEIRQAIEQLKNDTDTIGILVGINRVGSAIANLPTADVAEVKQIEIIRDDLKWWLETNTEVGVVHIPKFVLENMIKKMTRTPKERGE